MATTAGRRAMFVWLPNFAMVRARLKMPARAAAKEPFVLLEKFGNIRRIAALDAPAVRAGLYLHQPLADALAVLPTLIAADAEPEADRQALSALAVWAQRFSPFTAPAFPDGLWLDITGCAHLWSGEERFAEGLLRRLEALKVPARAAIAPTYGAAYALAHHTERFAIAPDSANPSAVPLDTLLAPLPVDSLRISKTTASTLSKLGLFTVGQVQKLPRAGLSRRFPDLLPQLDKALGRVAESVEFLQKPTPWVESLRFADPISAPADIERATVKLLERICRRLKAERQGALCFEARFFRADGGLQFQSVATASPTRDAGRVMRLFREKLGKVDPGFGIDSATLYLSRVEPLAADQAGFLREGYNAALVEELAALIEALENRLGQGRVYRLEVRASHIPERAVKKTGPLAADLHRPSKSKTGKSLNRDRAGAEDCTVSTVGERPIRLFLRPHPIEVTAALPDAPPILFRWRKVLHRVIRADGPERICPEWWDAEHAAADENDRVRDYYRVENAQGLRFWVFREGVYGGDRMPRWYLHGVFA